MSREAEYASHFCDEHEAENCMLCSRNAKVIELMEEAESYCWAAPRGWADDTPDKPRCNRPRGHDGNHVMHVVWAPDTDLSAHELAVDRVLGALVDERMPAIPVAARIRMMLDEHHEGFDCDIKWLGDLLDGHDG